MLHSHFGLTTHLQLRSFCVCVQVQPPDSPPCPSPLQASLHSQGSEGSGQQDDFVMVDFVRTYCWSLFFPLTAVQAFPLEVQHYNQHNITESGNWKINLKINIQNLFCFLGFLNLWIFLSVCSDPPSLKTTCCQWIWAPSTESFRTLLSWPASHYTSAPSRWPMTW